MVDGLAQSSRHPCLDPRLRGDDGLEVNVGWADRTTNPACVVLKLRIKKAEVHRCLYLHQPCGFSVLMNEVRHLLFDKETGNAQSHIRR